MPSFPSRLGSHAKLLGRMIRLCSIDPGQFSLGRAGLSFTAVARVCMACESSEICRAWLDRAERAGLREPPEFCPNSESFRLLRSG